MEKDYKERFFRLLNAVNNISKEMLEAHTYVETEYNNRKSAVAYCFGYASSCLKSKSYRLKKIAKELND